MRQPLSERRTHGWEHAHRNWSGGNRCSAAAIGHTGFTGTGLWIDFASGRAWTLLHLEEHADKHAAMSREWHLKRDRKFRRLMAAGMKRAG